MDESTELIASLQHKLAELDAKVDQYRREMTAEYGRYAESLLSRAPKVVSDEVTKAVEATKADYKNLQFSLPNPAPYSDSNNVSQDGSEVKPQIKRRDREDRGIFNPSYLPLLDTHPGGVQSPIPHLLLPGGSKEKGMGTETTTGTITSSITTPSSLQEVFVSRFENTDEVSVLSDSSDGPVRRSALRRSSSSSKPMSPRRVRFDVAGQVVLPTATPVVSSSALASSFKVGEKEKYNRGSSLYEEDDDDIPLSEQIEDIDSPPPKRVSSSQALRALSRNPIDDPSQWTTVSAGPDGSASIPKTSHGSPISSSDSLFTMNNRPTISKPSSTGSTTNTNEAKTAAKSAEDEYESSDDELVFGSKASMTRQRPTSLSLLSPIKTSLDNQKPKSSANTPKQTQPGGLLKQTLSGGASTRTQRGNKAEKGKEEDAEDQFFADDEPTTKYQASSSEHSDSEPDDDEIGSAMSPIAKLAPVQMSQYSSSPARAIPQPSGMRVPSPPARGIVGSFRGEFLHIPVVSDELHAQAAAMGPVNSFVGSLNGRSGLDEGDMHSFRASGGYGSFSSAIGKAGGGPRSLGERLMMEELSEGDEQQAESPATDASRSQNVKASTMIQGGATETTRSTVPALGGLTAAATTSSHTKPSGLANPSQLDSVYKTTEQAKATTTNRKSATARTPEKKKD